MVSASQCHEDHLAAVTQQSCQDTDAENLPGGGVVGNCQSTDVGVMRQAADAGRSVVSGHQSA